TLTATVSPASAMGSIQFMDGAVSLGGTTIVNGAASFSIATLSAGNHSLTAVYSGGTNENGSAAATLAQSIGTPTTTTSLPDTTHRRHAGWGGDPPGGVSRARATGTVLFLERGSWLATPTIANGPASPSLPNAPVGAPSLTAVCGADPNDQSSASAAVNVTVT